MRDAWKFRRTQANRRHELRLHTQPCEALLRFRRRHQHARRRRRPFGQDIKRRRLQEIVRVPDSSGTSDRGCRHGSRVEGMDSMPPIGPQMLGTPCPQITAGYRKPANVT